jgi:hypothetical protein
MNLLVHQGALGDWVLTFPLLRDLAQRGPTLTVAPLAKAKLAAAIIPGAGAMPGARVSPGAGVRAMDIEAPPWRAMFGPAPAPDPVLPPFAPSDILVSFVSNGQDAWANNLRVLAPQSHHIFIDPRPPRGWPGHVTAWYAHQAESQGMPRPDLASRDHEGSGPQTDNTISPADPLGPIIIHPGSGGRDKCWPRERFAELINLLREQGRNVQIILGEVELDWWPPAVVREWTDRYAVHIVTSLMDLHDILRGAALLIGNDAGPTHLAAQMGIPTLALFGPTPPRLWAPIGPRVTVLAPPQPVPMTWLEVPHVLAAADQNRRCKTC